MLAVQLSDSTTRAGERWWQQQSLTEEPRAVEGAQKNRQAGTFLYGSLLRKRGNPSEKLWQDKAEEHSQK